MSVPGSMSKISTVNTGRNLNINAGSAWARGPPATSTPSAPSNQPPNPTAATSTSATVPPAVPRPTNGQPSHSRRSSAAFPNTHQPPPAALKDPVAVSKSAAAPIPTMGGNLQFGTVDDNNAVLSTSPAPPATIANVTQIKSFGSIDANTGDSGSSSPAVAKITAPARTDSPAPAGKPKKKLDVNSLFQKPQQTSTAPPAAAPTPAPVPQQAAQSQAPPNPIPSSQDGSTARPPPKHQASFDSPSMRNNPLPVPSHPNQTPSTLQPGAGPPSYHFTPPQQHLRQGGNGAPGFNPPRSPNLSRAMTNGSMRGPPGGPVPGALGSPRMGPPTATPTPSTPAPTQTPIPGVPPPGMMNAGQVPHPPHMPSPLTPMPQGQMPPQMGMPQMWGYYYQPYYDPNMPHQPHYWPHPPHIPPHMAGQPHAPPPQQPPLPMPQANLATPSQAPVPMPMSPRVPPSANMPTPQTPSTPLTTPGNRSSFISTSKRPITIKNTAGEEIDITKLRGNEERKSTPVRLETEDAYKKRIEEEKLRDKDKSKKDEDLAKVKAKRDAEAKERAKRDQEEKERRKREQEDAEKMKLEDEQRAKREVEETEQREKEKIQREEEERLRKIQEEEERKRIEAEEKEKARLAEIEAKRLAEEEAQRKAEEEAKRLAEEEAKRKAEEEAKLKEEEERKKREEEAKRKQEEEEAKRKEEEARLKAEAELKAKQEEEAKQKAEQEAAAASAAVVDTTSQSSTPLGSTPAYASPAHSTRDLPKTASALPPSLDPKQKRPIPGRLDLSSTSNANLPQPLPSALASARIIEDIGKVSYPEGIKAPSSELNVNAPSGKFRYDRDFLMQFMKVCKEKPDDMPSLDAIGLEPSEQTGQFGPRRGGGGGRTSMSNTPTRNSIGLGLNGPGGAPFDRKSFGGGGMGQFQAPTGRSSEERFAAASIPRAVSGSVPFPRQTLGRTNSTSGPQLQGGGRRGGGDAPQRTQSGRGSKRVDSKASMPSSAMQSFTAPDLELHTSENAWSGAIRKAGPQDQNSPEFIDRKVKSLLNKLTMEKFESISQQILDWANRSVNESDGRTLIQVIKLVFEKATDEATWSEMYARLCRFLMERISQDVRDEGIKSADGKPIAGGNLFRKYLLNRCQEDFERGWSVQEAAKQAAASKAEEDKAAAAAAQNGSGEEVLYSEEYYASQKAKRRGLGLVKFIGELFKLQMLTERIMHECIKKLLSNVENPEEEEIESLCKLLHTVGQALDTPKARNHMDIYFSRMQELANSGQISSRIQFMLMDIIDLRGRKWVARTQVAAPSTIAEVHQKAERDRQVAEREAALRQAGGRDRTGRRETRDPSQVGVDGWTTPVRQQPPKAGDLSRFGKISKPTTMQFGPSSVFSKGDKRESTSVTRVSSSSNMFAALNSNEATPDAVSIGSRTANSTRPPSRKGSVDFSASSIDGRRKLLLQPRTQAVASDAGSFRDDAGSAIGQSEQGDDDAASAATSAAPAGMTADQAKRKIKEDVKELFMLRQPSEAESYFSSLPSEFRWQLIEELVTKAIDAKQADVQLVSDTFGVAVSKSLVDEAQFLQGFAKDMEYLEDTSTDSPNAYANVASLLKAANLSQAAIEGLADKILVEGEMAVTPKEKLLKKYDALMT